MPQLEQVIIEITQGEDFMAQIYWSDELGEPHALTTPCRMDVRDSGGQLVLQFATENSGSLTTKAALVLSASAGFIQMSCPRTVTRTLPNGRYRFDLFVNAVESASPFTDDKQAVSILEGWIDVQPRTTILEAAAS